MADSQLKSTELAAPVPQSGSAPTAVVPVSRTTRPPATPSDRARYVATGAEVVVRRFVSTWMRILLTVGSLLVQLGVLVVAVSWFARYTPWVLAGNLALSLAALVFVLHRPTPATYKLAWAIPIAVFPLFGSAFYLLYGAQLLSSRQRRRMASSMADVTEALDRLPEGAEWHRASGEPAGLDDERAGLTLEFLSAASPYRPAAHTAVDYFPLGELAFERMLEDLEAAERYILCEYFIIAEGEMWGRIFEVLARKAQLGLDVRLLYDDLGSFGKLPLRFRKVVEAAGIQVHPVNPFGLGVTMRTNNRDHRKILVVDGRVGYTGGINLADEYINRIVRFGHWKDTAVRMEGPAVWSLVVMFLALWEVVDGRDVAFDDFRPDHKVAVDSAPGLVLPYDDSPFDNIPLGSAVYRHLMNRAERTIDICTPYLVIDGDMEDVLATAAASGVRVRIITPHIPDKSYVHAVSRSFYTPLIGQGVEIYEYTPGFMHAKSMVVDGTFAVIGTINLDYRSLYLHQENAVFLYATSGIAEMTADFEETIAQSERITLDWCLATRWPQRMARSVLRVFAPMM